MKVNFYQNVYILIIKIKKLQSCIKLQVGELLQQKKKSTYPVIF